MLIAVGSFACIVDNLPVGYEPSDSPEHKAEKAKRVELIIRSLGSIVWALAWLYDRIENPAIRRRRQRGIDKRKDR